MVQAGWDARQAGEPLKLAPRILADDHQGFPTVDADFDLAELYPQNEAFRAQDEDYLRAELAQAVHKMENLPSELHAAKQYTRQVIERLNDVQRRIKERNKRIRELRTQNEQLREELKNQQST